MKKFFSWFTSKRLLVLFALVALAPSVVAQEFRVRFDGSGEMAPSFIGPKLDLKDGPLKGVSFFTFGGFRFDDREWIGGVGSEYRYRLASNLDVSAGLGLEFTKGRRPRPVYFVGISIRE